MYGDYSRVLDGPTRPYSAVLAQQGRLLLDSELNEQTSILLDYMRRLTTDLVGPFAGPVHHSGFAVEPVVRDGRLDAVRLSRGHYYVYGLRCESPAAHRSEDEPLPIGEQRSPFVLCLVVWEQSVSAIQAPELADPALGPGIPDTTRRRQVRWRPHATRRLPGHEHEHELVELAPESVIAAFHAHNADPHRRPLLGARASSSSGTAPGPDAAPVGAAYRGVENQLYRVEIHRGGEGDEATFKWSRDNGSVEVGLQALSEPEHGVRTATISEVWYDARQGLEVGDWVELVDDDWAPIGVPAPLMQVHSVALATHEVTLLDTLAEAATPRPFERDRHPILRRWDQAPDIDAPSQGIPVRGATETWFELEDGVQVRFEARAAQYERGDYWLIPARTATGGVLWPRSRDEESVPLAVAPDGPARYLAPLALVTVPDADTTDLRLLFSHRLGGEHHGLAVLGGEHREPVAPESALREDVRLRPAPTAIRPAAVTYRARSVSSVLPGNVFPVLDGTTVGRDNTSGIVIDHPDVSRHHASFALDGDVMTIVDVGSTNGTKVNDQPVTAQVPVKLSPGDTIELGSPEVQLQLEEE